MGKKMLAIIFLFFSLWACNDNNEVSTNKPEGDADVARMFIRNALDGKWKDAKTLIVQDSANQQILDNVERSYLQSNDVTTQRGYREAQIRIHDSRKLNDSTTVIVYSNTFKNKQDSVKAVRIGNQWLIDLKYSFPNTNPAAQ